MRGSPAYINPQGRRDAIAGLLRRIFKRFYRLFGAPPIFSQLLEEIDALIAISTPLAANVIIVRPKYQRLKVRRG
jgi:hypothetical protein